MKRRLFALGIWFRNHMKWLSVVLCVLVLLVLAGLTHVMIHWPTLRLCAGLIIAAVVIPIWFGFISRKPSPTRPPSGNTGGPCSNLPMGNRDYIESKQSPSGESSRPYSCSFVEFDGLGDYLDFQQHANAWKKAKELAAGGKLLFVMYCHGWKNNSQSEDVVRFVHFLRQLAVSDTCKGVRVHGLYLGWYGNVYKPCVDTRDPMPGKMSASSEEFLHFYHETKADFGEPIVDLSRSRRSRRDWRTLAENLSYWGRKRAPENKVCGVPMARTIFSAAMASRRAAEDAKNAKDANAAKDAGDVRIILIGHSFGALMLERCVGQASISAVNQGLSWFSPEHPTQVNPLPFDLVLFVNSAAPSIYAKEMKDFLTQHYAAMNDKKAQETRGICEAPIVVSVTSCRDWATGLTHPIGNSLACWQPSMNRNYKHKWNVSGIQKTTPQYYYYELTPGHNPLLVDHWADVPAGSPGTRMMADGKPQAGRDEPVVIQSLLQKRPPSEQSRGRMSFVSFFKRPSAIPPIVPQLFILDTVPPQLKTWSEYDGDPVPGFLLHGSSYWIVRCSREIIHDHGDVWSQTAMNFYTALYRRVMELRLGTAIQNSKGEP